jgi:hypothetical protein
MISLTVNMEGDDALKGIGHVEEADSIEVLVLDGGMDSGKPSVTLHFTVDGRHAIAQTSANAPAIGERRPGDAAANRTIRLSALAIDRSRTGSARQQTPATQRCGGQ